VQQAKTNGVTMRWLVSTIAGAAIGLSVFAMGTADAEPAQPGPSQPGPTPVSTSDELADMDMDVIHHDGPAAPTTTPVPAPPH
jgi:hypothetical protein